MNNYFQKACDNLRLEGLCALVKENDSLRAELKDAKENLDITVEAHIETQQMWNKESKELRNEVEGLRKERDNWKETARMSEGNKDYYRGLVISIGKSFGEIAYISDDGSKQQDVLCAKVLELVKSLQSRLSDLLTAAEPFMKELKSLNEWCIHDDLRINFSICTVGDLRTLSAAVDRVREEK